jgi:hypothetical protein
VVRGDLQNLADFDALQPCGAAAADPQPGSPRGASAALWATHGLRLFSIPIAQLPELERRLGIAEGASTSGLGIQRQWLGQSPAWSPFVEGPALGPIGIWMETGPLALPAGHLRLLGRAWTEPIASSAAADACLPILRVELAPQHADEQPPDPFGFSPPAAREPADEGLVFRRLALALRLSEARALVIIPERPDVVWGESPRSTAASDAELAFNSADSAEGRPTPPFAHVVRDEAAPGPAGESGADPDAPPADIAANAAAGLGADPAPQAAAPPAPRDDQGPLPRTGPRAPRLPTLGEAMLMSTRPSPNDAAAAPARTTRAIVVLIPRLPDEYRLLPR